MKGIVKLFKAIIWTVIVLVALAVAAVLTVPLWIGPAVTGCANAVVPGVVKTDFRLNEFGLNPYTGTLHVGDMQLANPTNYPKENCVALGSFDVKLKPLSLATKKIHIENITLDGLAVAATAGFGNFRQLAENVQGEEAGEGAGGTGEETAGGEPGGEVSDVREAVAEECDKAGDAPNVVIDKLVIKGVVVKLGVVPIPLPPITIEGIGAEKEEGASLSEAADTVMNKIMECAGALGGALGEFGSAALDAGMEAANAALEAGTEAANAAMEAVSEKAGAALEAGSEAANAAMEAVGEKAGAALGAGSEAASAAMGVVGEGASATMDAVSSGAGAAIDAVGGGAGAAVDAVKDVGGAAMDGIKGLFK